jgi:NodT family efflux transporter outer membrane factor (OMF) lipoprotein
MPASLVASGARGLSSRVAAICLSGASVLALSACASFPPAQPAAEMKPIASYAVAQSLAAPQAEWPADAWWKAYNDPQLNGLMDEALAGSPAMAVAAARVRQADAQLGQAHAAQLPSVTLNASAQERKMSYNDGIPPAFVPQGYNPAGHLALDFSWDLDLWGANRAAVAAASSNAKAAGAEAADARLMLTTNIALTYADLARLYAQRDVADRTLAARQETADLVQGRVTNGLDNHGALDQALAGPASARVELSSLDEQITLTRNALAALAGGGPDRGLSLQRPSAAALKPFGLPENLAADLIGRRPDVVAARWRAEAAGSSVKTARAQFYPNINLAAMIGFEALPIRDLFKSGSDIGQDGPALSLPIFEGGRLRAGLKGAEARRDEAVAQYDARVVQALHDVADAVASQRALAPRIADARKALEANEQAYRIARLRYDGKLDNYQSVLLAEEAVLAQRRVNADLESRALALDVALVRALGGGFGGVGFMSG